MGEMKWVELLIGDLVLSHLISMKHTPNCVKCIGMDVSMPPMCLCRRRATESYCTGDLTTQFSLFFSTAAMYMLAQGMPLFLRGRGTIECDSWTSYFPTRSWMTHFVRVTFGGFVSFTSVLPGIPRC